MIHQYIHLTNGHAMYCFLVFSMMAILEICYSIAAYPFVYLKNAEIPSLGYVVNEKNLSILRNIPSLKEFNISWFAKGPRAQTMLQAFARLDVRTLYVRELVKLKDDVNVALDWKENSDMTDETPIVLCLHGLGGNSNSRYLQTFTSMSYNKGYRTVVYNRRGHGGISLLSTKKDKKEFVMFPKHSNMEDMEFVVDHLCRTYPLAPKYMIGFSCGANLGIKYISSSKNNPFIATASISNGYDIDRGTKLVSETSPICDGIVTQFLKGILFDGRLEEVKTLSQHLDIDFDAVMKTKSIRKIEELLILPLYGYKSLEQYYELDSCHNCIQNVKSHLLCIANKNDPLIPSSMTDIPLEASKHNENIISVITKRGGHIGWIEDDMNNPWYAKVFFEYIHSVQSVLKE
jgi:abhydrolase domain-containing protein 1/3